MDGVLWRGPDPILDISKLFACINAHNLSAFCITNNSTRTADYHLKRLEKYGVSLNEKQMITSAEATADYLATKYPAGGSVYVVGEQGLVEALQNRKFFHIEIGLNQKCEEIYNYFFALASYFALQLYCYFCLNLFSDFLFPIPSRFHGLFQCGLGFPS